MPKPPKAQDQTRPSRTEQPQAPSQTSSSLVNLTNMSSTDFGLLCHFVSEFLGLNCSDILTPDVQSKEAFTGLILQIAKDWSVYNSASLIYDSLKSFSWKSLRWQRDFLPLMNCKGKSKELYWLPVKSSSDKRIYFLFQCMS